MKILVYRIGSLGDTLVAVPSLWVIRENFPNAHITMLTDEQPGRHLVQAWEVLDGSSLIDDYITYPGLRPSAMARLLFSIRKRNFDAFVYLIGTNNGAPRISRDIRFFKLAGIRNFIGTKGFCTYPPRQPGKPMPVVPHIADTLLERLRTSDLQTPPVGKGRVDVNIAAREREGVDEWLDGLPHEGAQKWLAIGPRAKMPSKIWPLERYSEVVSALIEDYDLWPVVYGGANDRQVGENLVLKLGRGYVAAGELTVRESIAAMERCILYLGNDTGTMHMAVSAGLQCVVPSSSRNYPGQWYPYGKGHLVLRTQVPCEGCGLEKCTEHKMECILSISVEQVLQACRDILSGRAFGDVNEIKKSEISVCERDPIIKNQSKPLAQCVE